MVVHLKRFRQSTKSTNKLETLVEFPLEGFDMSPNMARSGEPGLPAQDNPANGLKVMNAFSPWKHPKRFRAYSKEDTVYELYSVCNHHGSDLLGGHYTAFCKNPTDGQWYSFDDMHTKLITDNEVITKDAYILFYQKTCLNPSSSSSSCSSGSSAEHWVYRMPDFYYKTKSETRCAPNSRPRSGAAKAAATLSPERSRFIRNGAKYATLPVKKCKEFVFSEAENHSDTEVRPDSDTEEIETVAS